MNLEEEITEAIGHCKNTDVASAYYTRLAEGDLLRDENMYSHFCAYFLPYNPQNKTLLIGDHKKSGKWLVPGGHIDARETLLLTLNREIKEELGVTDFFSKRPQPFLITITDIEHDVRACKKHFDLWHLMVTDGKNFMIDDTEYHETRWVTIEEARELTNDHANIQALNALKKMNI